jgi:DegV family protein with EDD domain
MIGICTDSNSQLPQSLAERYAVEVVPVTVTVNDHDYLEGVDLDVDDFYEMLGAEPPPRVSTSRPSPGQFAASYDALLHRGCDEILSIHVTAATSGTLNSARLAARLLPIPVRLVDSGTAGFGVSCCVWAAGAAIARGAKIDEAVQVVESLTPRLGAVFVVGQLGFFPSGGGQAGGGPAGDGLAGGGLDGVPVMTVHEGHVKVVSRVSTLDEAIEAMAATARGWGNRLNVAIGRADRTGEALSQGLVNAITGSPNVLEVVRYRIGPSVGVYAGLGAVGCFMFPAE